MSFFDKLKKNIGVEKRGNKKEPSSAKIEEDKKSSKDKSTHNKEKSKEKITLKRIKLKKEIPDKKEKTPLSSEKSITEWLKPEGQLTVDVYQTDSEFCVESPIAGVDINDIDILIENNMLIIRDKREEEYKDVKKDYFYQECYWGSFARKVLLPENTDIQRVKASLKNGILFVKIPIIKKVSKRKVIIEEKE